MEQVKLTPAMRQRVLENVRKADRSTKPRGLFRLHTARQLLSVAACVAVLAVGVIALPNYNRLLASAPSASSESAPAQWADTESFSSLAALNSAAGLSLPELQPPFEAQQTEYTLLFGTLAQVTFTGTAGETLSLRAAQGTDDVSGDYSVYDQEQTAAVGNATVTLKGTEQVVQLAVWQQNGISYAISAQPGLTQEQMLALARQCR